MSYSPFLLQLSEDQLHKLGQGKRVKVKSSDIGVGGELPLTARQITKLEKAKRDGKGAMITLSKAQISHLVKYGSGVFSDFFKAIPRVAKDAAKAVASKGLDLAESLGKKGIEKGLDLASEFLQGKVDSLGNDTASRAAKFALEHGKKLGADYSKEQLANVLAGIKSTVKGKGLFQLTQQGRGLLGVDGKGLRLPGEGAAIPRRTGRGPTIPPFYNGDGLHLPGVPPPAH